MSQNNGKKSADYLDPTFADNGVLNIPLEGRGNRVAQSVVSLPAKKLLVLLSSNQGNPPAVAKLNEDGSVDRSFADNGFADLVFPGGASPAFRRLHPLPSGWLVTGTTDSGELVVVRQLEDGSPDTSFGTDKDGKVIINIYDLIDSRETTDARFAEFKRQAPGNNASTDTGSASIGIVAQQDGKILLISTVIFDSNDGKGIAVRLNVDGSLDKTFNGSGFVLVELPGVPHDVTEAFGATIQQDGKVLVCGHFIKPGDGGVDAYIIRYNQNGSVDSSYGGSNTGVVTVTRSDDSLVFDSLALKPDGGAIAVGNATSSDYQRKEGLVISLNPTGSFNLVFNNGKPLFADFTEHGVRWTRCVSQANGNLIVGGPGGGLDEHGSSLTARYNADGSLDQTFAGKGWADFNHPGGIDFYRDCAVMDDQRIVVAAYVVDEDVPTNYGYVLRYLP